MLYCPFCGTNVKRNENFCLNCGKKLPADLEKRIDTTKQQFNYLWLLPIGIILLFVFTVFGLYFYDNKQKDRAIKYYEQSEQFILDKQFDKAVSHLEKAVNIKPRFEQAHVALDFSKIAIQIQNNIQKAHKHLNKQEFTKALDFITESERELRSYHGDAANKLIDQLSEERDIIKFESVVASLQEQPSINDLKSLLWNAEDIKTDEAKAVAESIRDQIADYTYSKAVERLNKHQFSDAHLLVEDGLRYASNSEKLLSLQETIDKEQEAFETVQQERIEQAIYLAEEERELNEMEDVELKDIAFEEGEQGEIIITGNVESVATIPIHSTIVEYILYHDKSDEPFLSNKAFIYPDTLYPGESGKFEFIHYDIDEDIKITDIQIEKFTWYTN